MTAPAPHRNNFDFIRFCAAALVLFSHHYTLTGHGDIAPSFFALNSYGGLAVSVFFALSGYLVAQSYFADPHPWRFALRRILRIWPALTVVVVLCLLVLGPLLSELAPKAYLRHEHTRLYLHNILLQPFFHLPGVFETNASPAVNGSLWTIPLEVQCYAALMVAGFVGILSSRAHLIRFALLYIAAYTWWQRPELPSGMNYPFEFGAYFCAGALLFATREEWRARPLSWCAAVALAVVLCIQLDLRYLGMLIGVSWCTIYLGQMHTPVLSRFGRYGDFSYGMYLFAFPVQQTVILLFYPQVGFWASMALAFALTLLCAVISWYTIEKPALAFKPRKTAAASRLRHARNFAFYSARIASVIAAAAIGAYYWRIAQPAPPLAFFSPADYPEALAAHSHLGMVKAHNIESLSAHLRTAQTHNTRLYIDFSDLLLIQRPAEKLTREYTYQGQTYRKSFAPRPSNKIKDLPDENRLRAILAPYLPLLKTHRAQLEGIFLVDEPYMHGIGKDAIQQLATQARAILREAGLDTPLGITFSSAMFDAGFAQQVADSATAWLHFIENHYRELRQGQSEKEKAYLNEWTENFENLRLTTYDLVGHYYTEGGIPEGYDIIAYNLYTATLLQDAVQNHTLAWFAEQGLSPACDAFRDEESRDIRARLTFFQDEAIPPDSLERDRTLLDAVFACKSESLLHLAQKHRHPGQRLMLWGEASGNGFMEFTADGKAEPTQPELLIAARVGEEVQRTLTFYTRHRKAFDAGVMFFLWDDARDHSVELNVLGATSLPGVTRKVFDRIGK